MRISRRPAVRPGARFAAITVTLLLAALACGLAAFCLAGPAQAKPGAIIWKKSPNPTKRWDRLHLTARGPAGSLYAAGGTSTRGGDVWLVRYSATGKVLWTRRWDDPAHTNDYANAITSDKAGNVYVCGYLNGDSSAANTFVLKYNAKGRRQWAAIADFGGFEQAWAVGADASGNAYIVGQQMPDETTTRMYVAKLSAARGAVEWSWVQSTPDWSSEGYDIAVTADGTCYAAGKYYSIWDAAAGLRGHLAKVKDGVAEWERDWRPADTDALVWQKVKLAPQGGVVVADSAMTGPVSSDYVVARYSDDGDLDWSGVWNTPGHSTMELLDGLAVAGDGSIWVCGETQDVLAENLVSDRALVVRWDPAGVARAAVFGTTEGRSFYRGLTLDGAGNAYVVGSTYRARRGRAVAVKYTPAGLAAGGKRAWATYVPVIGKSYQALTGVVLGPSRSVYVVGEASARVDSRAIVARLKR